MTLTMTMRARLEQLQEHLRTPLYLNAYALIANQIASAGLGVVYWLVAAHLYPAEIVGQNSAIISTVLFLSSLATLSLGSAMIRFVPRAGRHTTRLVLYTYGINVATAVLVSGVFFVAGNHFQFTAELLSNTHLETGWLILATVIWCLFTVQDGVLIGLRQTVWVFIENSLFNISKLVLLLVGLWWLRDMGVLFSWFLPAPALVVLITSLIFGRFIPRYLMAPGARLAPISPRQFVTSVGGDYIGSLMAEAGVRLLPLLVINLLGKSANAYFYQAWMVATPLYLIASNMASSFTVEAAADMGRVADYSRRILRHMARLILPMAAVIGLGANLGLQLFGSIYAQQGTVLLRWLALAAGPILLNTWYLSYARVRSDNRAIILNQSLVSGITLGLSAWWLPHWGITSVGAAWFTAQSVVALLVLSRTWAWLVGSEARDATPRPATRNQIWRRADWRFLTSTPSPRQSVCFADGLLARSVAAISTQTVAGPEAAEASCDLAVAVQPNHATLMAARRTLHSAGVCYTEWEAWRTGGVAGIRRRLQAAGFQDIQLFWPYPTPAMPRVWLPVAESLAPCQFIVNQRWPSQALAHRLARRVLPRLVNLSWRAGLVPYLSAIAYPNTDHAADMFTFVSSQWAQTHAESAQDLSVLLQTGGPQISNKVVGLIFNGAEALPQWAVKMSRVPEDTHSLKNEQAILETLQHTSDARGPTLLIPRILFADELNGLWVVGQTALSGIPLTVGLSPASWRQSALQLADWQISLARHSRQQRPASQSYKLTHEWAAGMSASLTATMPAEALQATQTLLATLGALPSVCAHNDFAHWNLARIGSDLGVFDWSAAEWEGLPLLDLVYALANLAFALEPARDAAQITATYRKLLDPSSPLGKVFAECLSLYADAVGLTATQIAPLRLATWMLHSYYSYRNLSREQRGLGTTKTYGLSVTLPLWQTELEHQLRSRPTDLPDQSHSSV